VFDEHFSSVVLEGHPLLIIGLCIFVKSLDLVYQNEYS